MRREEKSIPAARKRLAVTGAPIRATHAALKLREQSLCFQSESLPISKSFLKLDRSDNHRMLKNRLPSLASSKPTIGTKYILLCAKFIKNDRNDAFLLSANKRF